MRKNSAKIKAQSAIEYAMVVICVVTGFLAMQGYITRRIQGKMRSTADSISERQYAPEATSGTVTAYHNQTVDTTVRTAEIQGVSTTTSNSTFKENETKSGSETSEIVKMP
jgi:hypothetical protein